MPSFRSDANKMPMFAFDRYPFVRAMVQLSLMFYRFPKYFVIHFRVHPNWTHYNVELAITLSFERREHTCSRLLDFIKHFLRTRTVYSSQSFAYCSLSVSIVKPKFSTFRYFESLMQILRH